MAEFAAVRPYFYEDYYPLTGYGDMTGDDIWLAYQLLRPSDQTGYVVAFPPRTLARRTESRAFPRTGTRSDLRVGKRR